MKPGTRLWLILVLALFWWAPITSLTSNGIYCGGAWYGGRALLWHLITHRVDAFDCWLGPWEIWGDVLENPNRTKRGWIRVL